MYNFFLNLKKNGEKKTNKIREKERKKQMKSEKKQNIKKEENERKKKKRILQLFFFFHMLSTILHWIYIRAKNIEKTLTKNFGNQNNINMVQ